MRKDLLKILMNPIKAAKDVTDKVNKQNRKKEDIIKKLLRKKKWALRSLVGLATKNVVPRSKAGRPSTTVWKKERLRRKPKSKSRPFIPHSGRMTATHGTGGSSLENYIDSGSSSARSEATSSSSAWTKARLSRRQLPEKTGMIDWCKAWETIHTM